MTTRRSGPDRAQVKHVAGIVDAMLAKEHGGYARMMLAPEIGEARRPWRTFRMSRGARLTERRSVCHDSTPEG